MNFFFLKMQVEFNNNNNKNMHRKSRKIEVWDLPRSNCENSTKALLENSDIYFSKVKTILYFLDLYF